MENFVTFSAAQRVRSSPLFTLLARPWPLHLRMVNKEFFSPFVSCYTQTCDFFQWYVWWDLHSYSAGYLPLSATRANTLQTANTVNTKCCKNQKHKQTNATVNCRSHRKKCKSTNPGNKYRGKKHSKYQKPTQNPKTTTREKCCNLT